jgi:flagellar basal-body rod protein FlgB
MFYTDSFAKNLDIIKRSMDVALLRREVIADNIANSDTPNFKRSEVTFESQLKRALDSEEIDYPSPYLDTERFHVFDRKMDYREVEPQKVLDYITTAKNNGNNVDIEVETMNLLQNQLLYQTMATALTHKFNQLNIVLR